MTELNMRSEIMEQAGDFGYFYDDLDKVFERIVEVLAEVDDTLAGDGKTHYERRIGDARLLLNKLLDEL